MENRSLFSRNIKLLTIIMASLLMMPSGIYAQIHKFEQKLQWRAEKNAMDYKVEVRNLSGEVKSLYFETEETFVDISLPAGKYQYRVYAYDFLGRESSVSEWTPFEITKALVPEIKKTAEKVVKPESKNGKVEIPVDIGAIEEDATVELVNTATNQTVQGILKVEKSEGKAVASKAEFPKVDSGEWKVKVTNPSGLSSESKAVAIVDKAAEAARIAEEKRLAEEEARLAAEEAARIAAETAAAQEAARLAEEKRLAEEAALEAARLAAEEEARLAAEEAARLAEEKRLAEEAEKLSAAEKLAKRREEQKKAEEEAARLAEEKRLAEEAAIAEAAPVEEEKTPVAEEPLRKVSEAKGLGIRTSSDEIEEEERPKKERKPADINLTAAGGILFSPFENVITKESDSMIHPAVIFKIDAFPVKKAGYRLGLEAGGKISYVKGGNDYYGLTYGFGIFDLNVIYKKNIASDKVFVSVKAGADVFLLNKNVEYKNTQKSNPEKQTYGYLGAQAGVSLLITPAKPIVLEIGTDYNHIFMDDNKVSFICPYAGMGVRW